MSERVLLGGSVFLWEEACLLGGMQECLCGSEFVLPGMYLWEETCPFLE